MSLYSYQIFQIVVKQKSFAKAAEILHLTPSAVSHIIAKMEADYGFALFIRSKKAAVLTDNGKQIYGYIQEILQISELLDKRISQINNASVGVVKFGIIDSVAVNWLNGILMKYREQCPDIDVQVKESGYRNLIEDVISHEIDIAIVSHSAIRDCRIPLQFIPLYKDRLVCVSQADFEPKNKSFVTCDELKKMKIILPQEGDGSDIASYAKEQEMELHPICSAVTNDSLVAMVRCGLGYGVTTELSVAGCDLNGIKTYPIVPFGSRTLGIISHHSKFLTPAALKLLSCSIDYVNTFTGFSV